MTNLRGSSVGKVNTRRVGQVILVITLVTLLVLAIVFFVAGVHRNNQISSLHDNGVPAVMTVTGCALLIGGSGSTPAGDVCQGTFTLNGHLHSEAIPGLAQYEPARSSTSLLSRATPPCSPQRMFWRTSTLRGPRSSFRWSCSWPSSSYSWAGSSSSAGTASTTVDLTRQPIPRGLRSPRAGPTRTAPCRPDCAGCPARRPPAWAPCTRRVGSRTAALQFIFGCAPTGSQRDDRRDRLTPDFVGQPYDVGISTDGMGAQCRFDLFGIHLFAGRVDAERTAPEEVDTAVGIQLGVVAADRIALTSDLAEDLGRAVGVFEVRERDRGHHRQQARLGRSRWQVRCRPRPTAGPARPERSGRLRALVPGGTTATAVGPPSLAPMVSTSVIDPRSTSPCLSLSDQGAPELSTRSTLDTSYGRPSASRLFERLDHRAGEGIPDDADLRHAFSFDGPPELVGVERTALEKDHRSSEEPRRRAQIEGGAVHQRRGRKDRGGSTPLPERQGATGGGRGVLGNGQPGQGIRGERVHLDGVGMAVHHPTWVARGPTGIEELDVITRSTYPGRRVVGPDQILEAKRPVEQW